MKEFSIRRHWMSFLRSADTGGGGGDAGGGDAAAGGQAGGDAGEVKTALSDAFAGETKAEGDEGAGSAGEGENGEDAADPLAPFALDLGEEFEPFKAEAEAFTTAANGYLEGIKDPVARKAANDALAWAAKDYQAKAAKDGIIAGQARFVEQVNGWDAATRADKEIGGANYDASVADAVEGIRVFGTKELVQVLHESGLGSHPEVIRVLAKAGRVAKETAITTGEAGGNGGTVSFANALYGAR